jgi:hypothetical protein
MNGGTPAPSGLFAKSRLLVRGDLHCASHQTVLHAFTTPSIKVGLYFIHLTLPFRLTSPLSEAY